MDNPYTVLGLPPDADGASIAAAYRKLVRRYPPELAPREFTRVQEAYQWLTSPARRMAAARTAPDEALAALFPLPAARLKPWEGEPQPLTGEEVEELLAPLRRAALRRLIEEAFAPARRP